MGTTLQIVGENLCEALNLRCGARVLDVAAGNGANLLPPGDALPSEPRARLESGCKLT